MQKKENRLSHVLLIYRKMIPSIRLCGHCQMEYLAQEGRIEYRAVQEMKLKTSDLNWADIVLLGRLDSWYEYQITRKLRKAGKTLIYIIDDDLLNIPPEISSAAYYGQKEIQGYIRGMIEMSDAILSPSPQLLKKYAVNGRKAIQIEEPAIDPVPYKPHDPDKPVKIGFAGSIDRTGDLEEILRDALLNVKREYGDRVEFEFFGAIPSFAGELNARCIPYCDSYDEYRKTLNSLEWDIGMAPMPETPFHACKHYNKYIEYTAAGIVGVYSKTEPYIRLLKSNTPGARFCENTTEAWIEAISRWLDAPEDLERARRSLYSYAQTILSVAAISNPLEDAIAGGSVNAQERVGAAISTGWLCGAKAMNRVRRGMLMVKIYGIRTPEKVIWRIRHHG